MRGSWRSPSSRTLRLEPAPAPGLRGSRAGASLMSCSPPAALSRRAAPLGPMPNEDIDVSNLERLKKYRSFDRYRRRAEREARDPHWWRTYREHFGEESGGGVRSWAVTPPPWDSEVAAGVDSASLDSPRLMEKACSRSCVHWWWLSPASIFHIFWSPSLENSLPLSLDFHL